MTSAQPTVEAHELRKQYGDGKGVRAALDGVSLTIDQGEFVAVLGPSGCGKSTLLGILGGLDRSYQGQLSLFGQDTWTMSDAALATLRGRRIGFVFQAFHLLGHLTALQNVLTPTLFMRTDRKDFTARAMQVLDHFGLAGRAHDSPSKMSGGERQRIAIARAMLLEPELLLCDEPTGNLDAVTSKQVVDIFERLHGDGLSIVAVTHEQRLADMAQRVVYMKQGKIVDGSEEAA